MQANKWIELRLQKLANQLTREPTEAVFRVAKQAERIRSRKSRCPLPAALAVVDVGPHAPPTYRLSTGDYHKPQEEVHAGFPAFLGRERAGRPAESATGHDGPPRGARARGCRGPIIRSPRG